MNKQIFMIWTQGIDLIPKVLLPNIEFVRNQNPQYKIIIYDLKLFEQFLKDKPSYLFVAYNKLNKKCQSMMSDYMRFILLYYLGGVYMDIKSRPNKPLDTFIKEEKAYVFRWDRYDEWAVGVIVSNKKNSMLKDMINIMIENITNYKYDKKRKPSDDVIHLCGPKVFTKIIDENDYDDVIKVSNKNRLKYIRYYFLKNHHKHYDNWRKFKEPLVLNNAI